MILKEWRVTAGRRDSERRDSNGPIFSLSRSILRKRGPKETPLPKERRPSEWRQTVCLAKKETLLTIFGRPARQKNRHKKNHFREEVSRLLQNHIPPVSATS